MKLDYHMHSLCSDGIYTIEEIIDKAIQKEVQRISITDHDTIAGIKQAKNYAKGKIDFLSGVEITCAEKLYNKQVPPLSIHLLGYGFDEQNNALQELLEKRKQRNKQVFIELLQDLQSFHYQIEYSSIKISCGNVLQLCDILAHIEKQKKPSKEILSLFPLYAEKLSAIQITVEEAITTIHQANGKVVWAHPMITYHHLQKQLISLNEVAIIMRYLASQGVDGIEAYYGDFTDNDRESLANMANDVHLFCTAGSDFHGLPGRDHMGVEIANHKLGI